MSTIQRVELHKSAEIPASAEDVWALLTDWAGMLRWSLSARRGGALGRLVKCDLIGQPDRVPRTRRMTLASGAVVDEELFHQDDDTKRIYYRKNDTFGTKGYIACAYIDAVDEHECRLHIMSWFDTEEEAPAAAARYEAIYQGIFEGFNTYFSAAGLSP
jgi:Polyketide cyclase / dehydrase and lipid transport